MKDHNDVVARGCASHSRRITQTALTGYSRSDAAALGFAYNGRDDRIAMVRGGVTRRFVTAPDGRVLGEYGASAADVKAEFIYAAPQVAAGGPFGGDDGVMGYGPLAVTTPDAGGTVVINWIHASHLGVPLVTTDAAGAPATTPNDYLLPGFPGQWRVLSDLYFNRHRDYDPTTGRYIQADPIGLEGGSNVYGYVEGNPVNAIDPEGLNPWALLRGAVIAGEITGEALVLLCRRYPGECMATIGGAAITIKKLLSPPLPAAPVASPPLYIAPRKRLGGGAKQSLIPRAASCDPDDDCESQWLEAILKCRRELDKPFPNRGITGGHLDVMQCARGHVDERCKGNPLDHDHDPMKPRRIKWFP